MSTERTLTRSEAFSRALDLYGELFAGIQDRIRNDAELATLRERFERGVTILRAMKESAADVPLSPAAADLIEAYLGGPDPEDHEAQREWLSVLPEVLIDIRRAEEAEDAARHARTASTAIFGEIWSTLGSGSTEFGSAWATATEIVWKEGFTVSEVMLEISAAALESVQRQTVVYGRMAESFERYMVIGSRPTGERKTSDEDPKAPKLGRQFAEAA